MKKKATDDRLSEQEYTDLIDFIQEVVDDERDNPDVQAWCPLLEKLKLQRQYLRKLTVFARHIK